MTNLGCNVTSCTHNEDELCCLNGIHVQGNSACKCDETCCGSYYNADKDDAKNSSQTPTENSNITCDAQNCIHNEDKVCRAKHIDISGISATSANETVCAAFECR